MSQSDTQPSPNESESTKPHIDEKGKEVTKQTIRRKVWEFLERKGLASFPRPVYGRIPNFKGSEEAAAKLLEIVEYQTSKYVEINPDKPQEHARMLVLENGKQLYVPVPRLKDGFLKHISLPESTNKNEIKQTVSRKGIEDGGKTIDINDDIHIDILVLGSVAVSKEGYRIGKGRGYVDLEFAILREMKAVDDHTVIVTTVHSCQVFDKLPQDLFQPYDVPVDYILTPTDLFKVDKRLPRPAGIIWSMLSNRRVNLMPVLQSLKEICERQGNDVTLKEVDTDVESYEPRRFNKFRRFNRQRPRSSGRTSESQGEGDISENSRAHTQRHRRFFRRRPLPRNDEHADENGDSVNGDNEQSVSRRNQRPMRPRRPFRRNRPQIDFSLMVSNIERSVRVRDLKNALSEQGIKPNDITWRGYKGFCYLHYAKPNNRAKPAEPRQVDNVIEILQNLKISPDSETNLSVKVVEPISRIETTDVTAV